MTKPLNQEEKERLAAYKEQFKSVEKGQNAAFMEGCARSVDLFIEIHPVGSELHTHYSTGKAKLLDYADLLEREHL